MSVDSVDTAGYRLVHMVVIALVVAAAFMIVTAGAWGPVGAVVISLSVFVLVTVTVLELLLLAIALVRRVKRSRARG